MKETNTKSKVKIKHLVGGISCALLLMAVPGLVSDAHAYRSSETMIAVQSAPHHARDFRGAPVGYQEVWVGRTKCFYHEGRFYRRTRRGFMRIDAPIGAIVSVLPHPHRAMVVGRVTYYSSGGTHYRRIPSGYMVVAAPGEWHHREYRHR